MKDCNIWHCKQKYLIRSGWSFSMPSSRIVTDTPNPGVVKTKSKGSCVNRSTYLSHLSNLSSNSKTEVLTSDSQVPSTFHHHVQVVTSDEVRIMMMKMIMAMEMVMRQKIILILDLFKYHMSSHIGSFTSDHGWKKNTSSRRGLCQFFFILKDFSSRGAESHFSKFHIFMGLLRQRPLSNQD